MAATRSQLDSNAIHRARRTVYMMRTLLVAGLLVILDSAYQAHGQEITFRGAGCARIPPTEPQNLRAKPTDGKVRLYWEAPSNGACVDEYAIQVKDLTASEVRSLGRGRREQTTDSFDATIDDLINEHEYLFSVEAKGSNRMDRSRQRRCNPNSSRPEPRQRRWGPFTWTADDDSSDDGDSSRMPSGCSGGDDNIDGDFPDAIASVKATPRAPARPVPPPRALDLPGAPTRLIARGHEKKVTLGWDSPADDGGCPITGYTIDASPLTPEFRTFGLFETLFERSNEVVIANLETCQPYRFEVSAENCVGVGPPLTVVAAPLPVQDPILATPITYSLWCGE